MEELLEQYREAQKLIEKKLNKVIITSTYNVTEELKENEPAVYLNFHYGPVGIHPKFLAVWYLFKKDCELKEAEANGLVDKIKWLTLYELKANGYPEIALEKIHIAFTTDEDIQRETGGNYYNYFK